MNLRRLEHERRSRMAALLALGQNWREGAQRNLYCAAAAGIVVAIILGPLGSGEYFTGLEVAASAGHLQCGPPPVHGRNPMGGKVAFQHSPIQPQPSRLASFRGAAVPPAGSWWTDFSVGRERSASRLAGRWAAESAKIPGISRISCRPAVPWLESVKMMHPRLLADITPPKIHALACLEGWSPGNKGKVPGACALHARAGEVRRLPRTAGRYSDRFHGVPYALAISDSGVHLTRPGWGFLTEPSLDAGGAHATPDTPGAVTPAQACVTNGGGAAQLSSSDRASLPGRSTRYRLIWLVCSYCGAKMPCLFYDESDVPVCANPSHGPMEVMR